MGLGSFVESSKRVRGKSSDSVIFKPKATAITAPAEKPVSVFAVDAKGSWENCRHLAVAGENPCCKQFFCHCKKDACKPQYRV
ncbi:hypothetical protein KJ972_04755 [Candidatus Micrarchaeota archaeon]|nr:hypothetical protein [Candidatus Micrarchaeota archaeon]